MKNLFYLAWVPFAYMFWPRWLGRKALHGRLVQMGYGGGKIPRTAMYEIADKALHLHRLLTRRKGVFAKMEDLYSTMSVNAEQIIAVIEEKNRACIFLASCHEHQKILSKHGIHTAPILVDRDGKRID